MSKTLHLLSNIELVSSKSRELNINESIPTSDIRDITSFVKMTFSNITLLILKENTVD